MQPAGRAGEQAESEGFADGPQPRPSPEYRGEFSSTALRSTDAAAVQPAHPASFCPETFQPGTPTATIGRVTAQLVSRVHRVPSWSPAVTLRRKEVWVRFDEGLAFAEPTRRAPDDLCHPGVCLTPRHPRPVFRPAGESSHRYQFRQPARLNPNRSPVGDIVAHGARSLHQCVGQTRRRSRCCCRTARSPGRHSNTSRVCVGSNTVASEDPSPLKSAKAPLMAGFGCSLMIFATDGTPAVSVMNSM